MGELVLRVGDAAKPSAITFSADTTIGLSAVRQRRVDDIVSAAMVLASDGYHAVHLRSVADRAGVATSTIYRYFSSKDQILMACFHRWILEFDLAIRPEFVGHNDPFERLRRVVYRMTGSICESTGFAESVTRAYASADFGAATGADSVRDALEAVFAGVNPDDQPSEGSRDIGSLIADLWITNILAVAQQRAAVEDIQKHLDRTVSMLRRRTSGMAIVA